MVNQTAVDATLITPRGPVVIAQASAVDAEPLLILYEATAQWMVARGIDQWRPGSFKRALLEAGIARSEFFVGRHEGLIVCALRLQWEDRRIWGEMPDDAGYVHSLVVAREWAGLGLGHHMFVWAALTFARAGKEYLRLDCSADNPTLKAYYEAAGFSYRGDAANTWRASLYERRVTRDQGSRDQGEHVFPNPWSLVTRSKPQD